MEWGLANPFWRSKRKKVKYVVNVMAEEKKNSLDRYPNVISISWHLY